MDAQDAVTVGLDHQFDERPLRLAGEGNFHRPEPRHVDIHLAVLFPRIALAQSHSANRRLGEHGGGYISVVEAHRLAVKFGGDKGCGLADRHGRQVDAVGHIAHGPDIGDIGSGIVIDLHGAGGVQRHPGRVQTQAAHIGRAPGSEHHLIGLEGRVIAQVVDQARVRLLDPPVGNAQDDADTAPFHLFGHMPAHVVIETAQYILAAINQRNF